jgi:hypothetical protein
VGSTRRQRGRPTGHWNKTQCSNNIYTITCPVCTCATKE